MKVVINRCFGGFSLSKKAFEALGVEWDGYGFGPWRNGDAERADPALVRVVETLGREADGSMAELAVVEIPDDVSWEISDYDGMEHVAEVHRTWP